MLCPVCKHDIKLEKSIKPILEVWSNLSPVDAPVTTQLYCATCKKDTLILSSTALTTNGQTPRVVEPPKMESVATVNGKIV